MANYKDRLIKAFPIFSQMLKRQNPVGETVVAGGAAGNIAVTDIKKGDSLVSVINLTDGTDVTAEFSIIGDGLIDNTGGTATTSDVLKVMWMQWDVR